MTDGTLELRCCPNCFRLAPLSQTFTDEGSEIRSYECQCGERFPKSEAIASPRGGEAAHVMPRCKAIYRLR